MHRYIIYYRWLTYTKYLVKELIQLWQRVLWAAWSATSIRVTPSLPIIDLIPQIAKLLLLAGQYTCTPPIIYFMYVYSTYRSDINGSSCFGDDVKECESQFARMQMGMAANRRKRRISVIIGSFAIWLSYRCCRGSWVEGKVTTLAGQPDRDGERWQGGEGEWRSQWPHRGCGDERPWIYFWVPARCPAWGAQSARD